MMLGTPMGGREKRMKCMREQNRRLVVGQAMAEYPGETDVTEATTLPPRRGIAGSLDAEPTPSPTAMPASGSEAEPTPGVTDLPGSRTTQTVGEELPVVSVAKSFETPSSTDGRLESQPTSPETAEISAAGLADLKGIWGWVIGAAVLMVAIVLLTVRLRIKPVPSSHRDSDADRRKKGRMPEKDMQNVDHISATSPYRVGYAQTIGKRPNQEDSYGASTSDAQIQEKGLLAVVADGIGGMEDGQIASSEVVRVMFRGYSEQSNTMSTSDRLLRLVANAQSSVLAINRSASSRCGSTVVSALANGDQLSFLSVGDSRIYLFRGGALLQLNREHKFGTGHDENFALGYTDEHIDARRKMAVTSYIGKENMSLMDRNTQPLKLMHGDRILLMTDGVFGTLSEEELIKYQNVPVQQTSEQIIAAVEEKNAKYQDNATVVIMEYL